MAHMGAGSSSAGRHDEGSSLRRQLRRDTAELHEHLEAHLDLLGPTLSILRYQRVLEIFYGFYAPVEARLSRLAAESPPFGFSLRARSELLASDLEALGLSRRDLAELPRSTTFPPLCRLEDLAGCLYVLEGASLGGKVIAPALERRLGITKESGASFFVGDAGATATRWSRVLTWLDGVGREGARSDDIVAAARATFEAFTCWVEERLAPGSATNPRPRKRHGRSLQL